MRVVTRPFSSICQWFIFLMFVFPRSFSRDPPMISLRSLFTFDSLVISQWMARLATQ
ncbi:hypothetical protein K493DRAFT_22802 [Basidiobolus meristosporus CBS 931.73]|uniref:Uncharacterized protein n=1 Tax=Basidiobolus meristosporus CBS 931.73 TaxID=1314790 RepID=A0A1Y1YCQ1_9FUNG|nr:hypothetical protein K493DRAFT_22802 [Basidiobolus meristosporus CBS 931.73]|eukprot:ORX95752.1 hypothetical protein K493DRAFT_22802 [Basidiobolus meristosporus CBS 931.73]